MSMIGRVLNNFKDFYNDINTATLTGAIDVIVVEQPDGSYTCSPFHVRFGKLGVLRSKEKVVDIEINGEPQDIHMKLGESGEAFFVEELESSDDNEIPEHLATSPIPVSEFESLLKTQRRRSFDLGAHDFEPIENQVNDYSKRRNTADNEETNPKARERDFIKRQITLGNLDIGENSAEDLTSSMVSNTKMSSEDLSKDNDISDTIFKMDSLELDLSKAESMAKIEDIKDDSVATTPIKPEEPVSVTESRSSGKKKRRKTKKKNAPRKSSSANQLMPNVSENLDKDSATERSSLESNTSENELKELPKPSETEMVASTSSASRKMLDPDFHFFSDTELATGKTDSRSNSPLHIESVQSDSEFEVKTRKEENKEEGQSWEWGGFPNVNQSGSVGNETETKGQEAQMSMLSSMFSFMKQNKRPLLNPTKEGVYLSDISSGAVDPEVAAIYFSTTSDKKTTDADMDCESGNGPSLTQSPNSAEGSKSIDSDFDEQNKETQSYCHDVSLSLCGWDPEPTGERFNDHFVSFADLCNNPSLFESNELVIRIKDKFYSWKVAAPIITSLMIFNRPLPQSTVELLLNMHMSPVSNQSKDKTKQEPHRYSAFWWGWARPKKSSPTQDGLTEKTAETKDITEAAAVEQLVVEKTVPESESIPLIKEEKPEAETPSPSSPTSEKYRKTLRLTSKQIAELNLKDDVNEVEFSVTTAYQGTTRCKCHLYKWKWDDKIVISDIDGTITKSDVLGHLFPIVGKDWAQSGVAQLFNKIKDNGYRLLYLSARAIGQAGITRDYLKSIRQGDLSMPDGPMLLNPTSLITAFHREVIEKKPEQFKISCMNDIKALFPQDSEPFYAGYGNRINDVWAYRAVGIPIVRIFTINPKGELKHELTQTFQSTYSIMSFFVDQLFPPILDAAHNYSQFVYWREPPLSIEDVTKSG